MLMLVGDIYLFAIAVYVVHFEEEAQPVVMREINIPWCIFARGRGMLECRTQYS